MKIIAMCFAILMLTACNAMEGLGKDIQRGGERLEKAAGK